MKRYFAVSALVLAAAMLASCSTNTGSSVSETAPAAVTATASDNGSPAETYATGTSSAETTVAAGIMTDPEAATADETQTSGDDERLPLTTTGSSGFLFTLPHWEEESYPDKMYINDEENVTLAVMRVGETYITYSEERNYAGWAKICGEMPEEVRLEDGEFAFITADISRMSGGVAGYMNNPSFRRIIDVQSASPSQIANYSRMEDYDPDDRYFSDPRVYGNYIIVKLMGEYRVYRDGSFVGSYSSQIEVNMTLGILTSEQGKYDMEEMGDMSVSVFCFGDTVLGYCSRINMSRRWQPILNSKLENEVPGYQLSDGQAGYMLNADITRVNGGSYENSPLITGTRGMEYVDYDVLVRKCGIPPVGEGMGEGNSAFDRNMRGTWLVFEFEGVYYVYLESGGKTGFVSSFDTLEDVKECINKDTNT